MANNSNNTPRLRFPEFTGEWEEKKLGDVATKRNRRNSRLEVSKVLTNSANAGIVDQKEYFDRDIAVKENTANYHIVEFEDFVYNPRISTAAPVGPISINRVGRGIMSPLYTVFKIHTGCVSFFEQYFQTTIWHSYLKSIANFGARFDRMNITSEGFFNMPLLLPSLSEQQKIAEFLSALDIQITAQAQKVDALKEKKKGLMQQLFPQSGETTPRLRFPGFEGEWKEKKFKEITFPAGKKNRQNFPYERYSISNEVGFYPQSEQFEDGGGYLKNIDCRQYIIVPPHSFAYNPARINVGSIGYQNLDKDVIVSSLYEVFQTKDECNDSFLWQWFHSDFFHKMVIDVQEGGVRQYFFYEKMKECVISLPSLKEQQKIAECLSVLDDQISAESAKIDALKNHKKGLMQQMFPQSSK